MPVSTRTPPLSGTGRAASIVCGGGRKRTSRHADTPIMDTPGDKRWVHPQDYEWGDMIDKQDQVRMLVDPTGPYVTNGVNAIGRNAQGGWYDQDLINREFGTTTAVITHAAEIRKMAHRVIRFQDGRISAVEVNETRLSPQEIEW